MLAGEYDPKLVEGWKADPKSGFLGDQRFRSQEVSEGGLCSSPTAACLRADKAAVAQVELLVGGATS
jgi:hypothetical protein